jgi:hypothetical protein
LLVWLKWNLLGRAGARSPPQYPVQEADFFLQYFTAKVIASLPEHPVVVEHWSSTRLQMTDKPPLDMSIVLQ